MVANEKDYGSRRPLLLSQFRPKRFFIVILGLVVY